MMHLTSRLALLASAAVMAASAIACDSGTPATKQAPPVDTPSVTVSSTPAVATAASDATGSTVTAGTSTPGTVVPPSPTGTRYAYTCEGGKKFEAVFFPADQQKATLVLEGRTLDLKQTISASGVRYTDGGGTLVLSTKGADAFIEQSGTQTYRGCTGAPIR